MGILVSASNKVFIATKVWEEMSNKGSKLLRTTGSRSFILNYQETMMAQVEKNSHKKRKPHQPGVIIVFLTVSQCDGINNKRWDAARWCHTTLILDSASSETWGNCLSFPKPFCCQNFCFLLFLRHGPLFYSSPIISIKSCLFFF